MPLEDEPQQPKNAEQRQTEKPPCKHERTKKDRSMGQDTRDRIYLDCGKSI
jgi:hypothetical protein